MRLLIVMMTALCISCPALAQRNNKSTANPSEGTRRHLQTIVFAGVAGGVLGLSTLSFYGRPQEKLSHIAIGAAIGIIGGAMYTTFKAATEPKDYYNSLREANPELWQVAVREESRPAGASFSFEF